MVPLDYIIQHLFQKVFWMKKLLQKFLVSIANFLYTTANRLGNHFQYFHINMDQTNKTIKFYFPKDTSIQFAYDILKTGLLQRYMEEDARRKSISLLNDIPKNEVKYSSRNYRLRQASEIYGK